MFLETLGRNLMTFLRFPNRSEFQPISIPQIAVQLIYDRSVQPASHIFTTFN